MFSKIDRDTSGLLSFDEFILTMIDPALVLQQKKVLKAFKAFDIDGGGSISIDEMQEFLSPNQKIPNWIWRQVLELSEEDDMNLEIGIIEFKQFLYRLFTSKMSY